MSDDQRKKPPHEHRLVWSGDNGGFPCVVCADGDMTPFYPRNTLVGTPYTGPLPMTTTNPPTDTGEAGK